MYIYIYMYNKVDMIWGVSENGEPTLQISQNCYLEQLKSTELKPDKLPKGQVAK